MVVRVLIAHTNGGGEKRLRKPGLDERPEIGVIVRDARIAQRTAAVFEADWALAKPAKGQPAEDGQPVTASAEVPA